MPSPSQKIISEIAQEIDCGSDCYYNSKTEEIIAIPNSSLVDDKKMFQEIFGENLKKIKAHQKDYIKIEPLQSFESFKIMEKFTNRITDQYLQSKILDSLRQKKPFQNFTNSIENSNYRQDWFDFKNAELEKIVRDILYEK